LRFGEFVKSPIKSTTEAAVRKRLIRLLEQTAHGVVADLYAAAGGSAAEGSAGINATNDGASCHPAARRKPGGSADE
jgi:hypothetical protein